MDALRASMMLLGLVLHSAASYVVFPLGPAWPFGQVMTTVSSFTSSAARSRV